MIQRGRRRVASDPETQLEAIRELVAWARDGFGPELTPGPRHGMPLLRPAAQAVATGRLGRLEHFLFLAALTQRRDVSLATQLEEDLCNAAVEVELSPGGPGMPYHAVRSRLRAEAQTALLDRCVAARVEARRGWAQEMQRQQQQVDRKRLRADFEAEVAEIISLAQMHLGVDLTPPVLGLRDLHLAVAWTRRVDVECAARLAPSIGEGLARFGADRDFWRNVSARAAERAAARMYEQLHPGTVHDVAADASTEDWRTHDLLAGGRPIDVKNVRYWRRRGHPIEESRVARFNQTPAGAQVAIAGMRSPAVDPRVLFGVGGDERGRDAQYLGQTDASALGALRAEFGSEWLSLEFSRRPRRGESEPPPAPEEEKDLYLPHWVFDLPRGVYTGRDRALARITPDLFADRWFWGDAHKHPLAFALMAGLDVTRTPPLARLEGWKRNLFRTLLDRRTRLARAPGAGLSLPVLYRSVLQHFLQTTSRRVPVDFSPFGYREILFFDGSGLSEFWPAGVFDPARTLGGLITALQHLWRRSTTLAGLRLFRLSGRGILEGRADPGDAWRTLVAYCGNCRFEPLVLGSHAPCANCHKLICKECGFCSSPPLKGERCRHPQRTCCGAAPRYVRSGR